MTKPPANKARVKRRLRRHLETQDSQAAVAEIRELLRSSPLAPPFTAAP